MIALCKRTLGATTMLVGASMLYAAPAAAQATRTWVSGVGDDVNPCSRTAPCKTFAGAISKTAAGGEINCLDPAGFGAVTITKSITLDCTGTLGSILNSSTTGIIVNAAGVHVIVRGISINGGTPTSPGLHGIRFIQGASLTVEDVFIFNQRGASPNGNGIIFQPNTAARLHIANSTIVNNGALAGGSGSGIEITPVAGGTVRATISDSQISNNANNGVRVDATSGPVSLTITDSVLSGNANGLVVVQGNVMLVNSDVSVGGIGIAASGATARVRVSGSTITLNATGISIASGASVNSYGNNRLDSNSTNGAFTAPVTPTQ